MESVSSDSLKTKKDSCGLRISEVINLTCEDIDFNSGTIKINNSKRNISRIIVLSDTMRSCLKTYIEYFNIKNGIVFSNTRENQIDNSYLLIFYRDVLKSLGLNELATLHNLRHQFTNTTYNLMVEKGYDEKVIIAYLHRYLGNNSIKEIEYYLHFTTERKKKLIENNNNFSECLYKDLLDHD